MGTVGASRRLLAIAIAAVLAAGLLQAGRTARPLRAAHHAASAGATGAPALAARRAGTAPLQAASPASSSTPASNGSAPGGAAATAPAPPAAPAEPQRFEAEQLAGGAPVPEADASGGAFASTAAVATPPLDMAAGTYVLQARVRSTDAHVDLTVDDAMTATYRISATWQVVTALVQLANGDSVGLRSVDASGAPRDVPVDVDWLSLVATAPGMTVRGNQILGTDGTPYIPKGVNFPFLTGDRAPSGAIALTDPPVDDVYVWGADAFRIQLNQEYWLANCPVVLGGSRTTTYRAAVADVVSRLTGSGVRVFLSLLATERGRATGCATPTRPWLKEMADQRSPSFWTSVAGTFASNPLVIFDLFNEPHDISNDVWLRGGTVSYPTTSALGMPTTRSFAAVGMQQLYDAVRATGATNLVSVSGPSWATDPRVMLSTPLAGYGIVVGSHSYCGSCASWAPHLSPTIDAKNDAAVLARYPLVVTEAGWKGPPDARYNRAIIDWTAGNGVGYLIYAFYVPGDYSIVRSWASTFDAGGALTKEPNLSGRPVWNDFASTRVARGFAAQLLPES